MEMEIVKPFGDEVNSNETEVICLSKQKIKMHFCRWSVIKSAQGQSIKRPYPFPIVGPKQGKADEDVSTLLPIDEGEIDFSPPPKKDILKFYSEPSDVSVYTGASLTGSAIGNPIKSVSHRRHPNKPNVPPYLIMHPETIHSGYLYIYHPSANGIEAYEEFYVNQDSKLIPTLLSEEDVRPIKDNAPQIDQYEYTSPTPTTPGNREEIWIAFSPVQWTYNYLKDTCKNPTLRENRMQKVVCAARKGHKNPNAHSPFIVYFNDTWFEDTVPCFEQDQASSMEILLDDPIYLADRISYLVEDAVSELARVIESIKTEIFPNNLDTGATGNAPDKDHCKYLHLLALTTYQFVFSSEENKENYISGDAGVNEELLCALLAIDERAYLSKAIHAYRNDLGFLITSQKYQHSLDVYLNNIETRIHDGRLATLKHIAALSKTAGSVDNHLRLELYQEDPKLDVWLKELCDLDSEKLSNTAKLLDKPVMYEEFCKWTDKEFANSCPILTSYIDPEEPDYEHRPTVASIAGRVFGAAVSIGEALPAWREITVEPGRFKLQNNGKGHITFDIPEKSREGITGAAVLMHRNKVLGDLLELHERKKSKGRKKKPRNSSSEKESKISVNKTKNIFSVKIKEPGDIDLQHCRLVIADRITLKKAEEVFYKVANHPTFLVAESLLQIVNTRDALNDSDEWALTEESVALLMSVASTAINITNTAVNLTYHFKRTIIPIAARSIFAKIVRLASNRVVPFLDVALGLIDAGNSFKNKDYDASAAHIAGAGVGLMAVLIGGAALWPLLLLSIGFVMLALYFTDNEIEHYFKFFALSNQLKPDLPMIPNTYAPAISTVRKPAPTPISHQVILNLCANMKNVCSYGEEDERITPNNEDQTFEMHYIKLMDFLCPARFTLRTVANQFTLVKYEAHEIRSYATATAASRTARIGQVSKLRLEIEVPASNLGPKQDKNLLELKVYVRLPENEFSRVPVGETKFSITSSKDGSDASSTVELEVSLPEEIPPNIGTSSFYVFFRLNTPFGYMPLPYGERARYFILPAKGFQLKSESYADESDDSNWLYEVKSEMTLNGSPVRVTSIEEFTDKEIKFYETGERYHTFWGPVTTLLAERK